MLSLRLVEKQDLDECWGWIQCISVWDEGGWGCASLRGAILWRREQSPPFPGAAPQGSWVCLELSQHSHPTPAPECLHGTPLEHSMITSWETPPRRAGDHLCPGVAPRGTVHPKGNAWICVKFQRKNTQVILAPCTSHVVPLLCIIPSSPCCSLKCFAGKPPNTPWIWKSDILQTQGGGLRFGSFFSCCAQLFRRPPLESAHGMDAGREWRSQLVKSTLYQWGENKTSPTGQCLPCRFHCRS